jgi:hypothetical protein
MIFTSGLNIILMVRGPLSTIHQYLAILFGTMPVAATSVLTLPIPEYPVTVVVTAGFPENWFG